MADPASGESGGSWGRIIAFGEYTTGSAAAIGELLHEVGGAEEVL
jgi:hypothetical protein